MKLVIIGGGHAAAQLVMSANMKKLGAEEITLITEEDRLPYQRPPLSKAYLMGDMTLERLPITSEKAYEKAACNILLNSRADSINRQDQTITLTNGDTVSYDKLVLATGGRVRTIPVTGADLQGVHSIKTLSDIETMKPRLGEGKNMVVIGGGYIGLEAAAVARKMGMNVTLLEAADRILQRVVAPEVSAFYTRVHTEEGVQIITDASVTEITGTNGEVSTVKCADGSEHAADVVVVGIGIIPNQELAADAGIDCSNGIQVNEFCQTNDPHIYAAGDVALHHSSLYGQTLRVESVQNAVDQAKVIIDHLNGIETPYNSLPWFWSDQYDLKLQIAGLSLNYDRIVVRKDEDRKVAFFYMKGDKLQACDSVNNMRAFMGSKKLITDQISVNDADLANPDVDLKSLI